MPLSPFPREELLDARDREVLKAAGTPRKRWSPLSSEGNSPGSGRKWSPNRWSPKSSKQYSELGDDESTPSTERKVSSAPTTPMFRAQTAAFNEPFPSSSTSPGQMSLPSPSPRARFDATSLKRRGIEAKSVSPRQSNQQRSLPSTPQDSPIFRFKIKQSPEGTEAILPGSEVMDDRDDDDDFAMLVKERQDRSKTDRPSVARRPGSTSKVPPSPPSVKSSRHLHELCTGISTLDDLLRVQTFLKGHYQNASKVDMQGRTPMHVFSTNKILAAAIGVPNDLDQETREYLRLHEQPSVDPDTNQLEKHVLRFLVGDLLAAYPGAMMIQDDNGQIPFEKSLQEWVQECLQGGLSNDSNSGNHSGFTNAVNNVWESTMKLASRTSSVLTGNFASVVDSPTTKGANTMEHGDSRSAILSPDGRPRARAQSEDHRAFTTHARLTPQARFCLIMLSASLDQLERYQSPELVRRSRKCADSHGISFMKAREGLREFQQQYGSVNIVGAVVETLAAIPDLMSTVLLIDDDNDREFVLSTSVIRRIVLSKKSVGPWLTKTLQSRNRHVAQRAADYLKTVSDELHKQMALSRLHSSQKSNNASESSYDDDVVDAFSRLQDFMPSLLALNERGIEDASTTLIVKKVLGRMISRPFAVTVILCDMLFLSILIIGFRFAVNRLIGGASSEQVLHWIYIANTGIFYFIIREIGKTVSLFQISTRARSYFLSFWNLIDALAVLLALTSTIVMRSYFTILETGIKETTFLRSLMAVTTGFLWLRVLSLLKAINIQLATFVLAILQITKDILWFCVILATLVVSFSQMFFTLLAPASCAAGDGSEWCNPTEYLLRVYTVLLGDFGTFEREQFVTGFSVFLVVIYSFLVTVVLLNVLIAVASDSYEKCLIRSQHLFGRARVMLIAELVAFQNLLQTTDRYETPRTKHGLYSRWRSSGRWITKWSRASILFFTLSCTVITAWTIAELLGYAKGEQDANILFSLFSVVVNVVVFAIIMAFLAATSPTSNESSSDGGFIQRTMLRILGVSRENDPRKKHDDSEWNGRVNYLENEMRRIADEQRAFSIQQTKTLEGLMSLTESKLRSELELLEDNFEGLRESILQEVRGTKRTNQFVTIAVQELRNMISSVVGSTAPPSEVNVDRASFRGYHSDDREI